MGKKKSTQLKPGRRRGRPPNASAEVPDTKACSALSAPETIETSPTMDIGGSLSVSTSQSTLPDASVSPTSPSASPASTSPSVSIGNISFGATQFPSSDASAQFSFYPNRDKDTTLGNTFIMSHVHSSLAYVF